MKIRGLVIAAIVLLILGGALYWSGHRKPSSSTNVSAHAYPVILNVAEPSVTQLTIKPKNAAPVTLLKAKTGDWQISEPRSWRADQNTVATMLATLSPLNSERVVEEKAANLSQYGLDQPAVEIDVTQTDHTAKKLLLGDDTPTGGNTYAMLAGDPRVFTVLAYDKTSLDKSLNDLRDKRLLPVDSDKISDVDLIRKEQEIGFHHNGDSWQIVKPKPLRADSSQVDTLVSTLTGATMDLNGTGSKDAAAGFAQATPVATAKVTDPLGTQMLQVRKGKDGYYAKSSAVDGVYKLAADPSSALDESLNDFRSKNLFDFSYNDPNKIEFHNGPKAYSFTRSGQDWWSDGKKMDGDSVESLVSQLRDLAATKFPDSGFTAPELEATVTSNDGKQVEKVLIAKSGNGYIAKRANEPSLYQLDASTVTSLETAVSSIKPAATPKPATTAKK